MLKVVPGTTLKFDKNVADNCYSLIGPLISITKGLTLSQVRELTGLESSTIQNWVKRGWVKKPLDKRYGEEQIMRIILINMMRGSMQLEQIAYLMNYINGSVDDRSDDIIPDRELFNILCSIIYKCDQKSISNIKLLDKIIDDKISDLGIFDDNSLNKLKQSVRAMILAFLATRIGEMAQEAFRQLM